MLRILKHAAAIRMLAVIMGAAAITGCTLNTDVSAPGGLIKYSGDLQIAAPNTALPTQLGVLVVSQFGERLKNIAVSWSITSGGGSLSSNLELSDESGVAAVTYTTGPTVGQAVIQAQVHGVPALTFNIQIM
jgi:hypothetical protein